MKKLLQIIIGVFGTFLLSGSGVMAGFGVSPTDIYNEYLKPGAHFEKVITLSRSDPVETMNIVVEPSLGEIGSWFKFEPGLSFDFPKGQQRIELKIIVDIPENASYRNYEGVIRVKAVPKAGTVQGVAIVKGARLDVNLTTTEEAYSNLSIKSLKMLDSVDGEPLRLEVVAENLGNVDISPDAQIVIKSLLMEVLEEHEDKGIGLVKANETKTLYGEFETALPEGEYFVDASILVDGKVIRKERLVFRITGPVGQPSKGEKINEFLVSSVSFVKENYVYFSLGLLLAIIIYIFLTKLWDTKKLKDKKERAWSPFLGGTISSRFIISILLGIVFGVAVWWVATYIQTKAEEKETEITDDEGEGETLDISVPLVVTPSGGVQGAKSGVGVKDEPTVVGLVGEDGKMRYPIYENPDIKSKIVAYAVEGNELKVMEELADWYKVEIDSSSYGWLEKANVKLTKTEER